MNQVNAAAATPVAAVLNARGAWPRIAALALSVLAFILPAIVVDSAFGSVGSISMIQTVSWSILVPLVIAAAVAAPAIPALASFATPIQVAAITLAGAAFIFLVKALVEAASGVADVLGDLYSGMGGTLDMGMGGYALLLTVILLIAATFIGRRKATT